MKRKIMGQSKNSEQLAINNDVLCCIFNHNKNENSKLWLDRFLENGFDAYILDSGSEEPIDHERVLTYPNICWGGMYDEAVKLLSKKKYNWLFVVCDDILIDELNFSKLLSSMAMVVKIKECGIYQPSTTQSSHNVWENNKNKDSGMLRVTSNVEGWMFLMRASIVKEVKKKYKDICFKKEMKRGWGIDVILSHTSSSMGYLNLVDDKVIVTHPEGNAKYNTSAANFEMCTALSKVNTSYTILVNECIAMSKENSERILKSDENKLGERKKSILITGVAGLVGSNMADWIIENHPEYEVVGIDNLFGGYIENVNRKVIFYNRDLMKDDIEDIFKKHHFEYVYHFAAYAAEGLSPFMRKFNYSNNVLSTVNIINNCIKYDIKRLIYTSSMSVYGHGVEKGRIFSEDDVLAPIDPYGISKQACELDIKVAGEQHGLDWCIIRPHNIYGEKQNIWDKYRNVLGIWMNRTLHEEPLLIYGDGEQTRAFSYIEDNLPCFWNAAVLPEASKQVINVGGTVPITINDAANMLCDITGFHNIIHKEARHEVKFAVPTYQKSIDLLGYKQTTFLKEGLEKMWEWVKQQPPIEQYKWENYEIDKGIYSYWK